jgi:hypothetical protein
LAPAQSATPRPPRTRRPPLRRRPPPSSLPFAAAVPTAGPALAATAADYAKKAEKILLDYTAELPLVADSEALVTKIADKMLGGQISATLKAEAKAAGIEFTPPAAAAPTIAIAGLERLEAALGVLPKAKS